MANSKNNAKNRYYPNIDRLETVESELKSQKFIINKILEKLEK